MKKLNNYACFEHKPTREERASLALALMKNQDRLVYKKIKRGFRTYCFTCNTYKTLNEEEMKQIKASNLCPTCHNYVKTGVKLQEQMWGYVAMRVDYYDIGYWVINEWTFGRKPKAKVVEQVMFKYKDKNYRINIVKGMGYHLNRTVSNGWRPCSYDYWGFFRDIDERYNYGYREALTKKEYYDMALEEYKDILKSNQKKIIEDNLLNKNQVAYMIAFNLKSIDQVLKFSSYMKKYDITRHEVDRGLNEFYLAYLKRNKISVYDFFDYQEQCETLKIKLNKPKYFQESHQKLTSIIKVKGNAVYESDVKQWSKNLRQYQYEGKRYKIVPFENVEEIVNAGDKLNNCLATYIERYAKRQTTIWKMEVDGELKVAIELKAGLLIQARTKNNRECSSDQNRIINRWLKEHGWKRW